MSIQLKFEEKYFSHLGESTIRKAKSLAKNIKRENELPLIEGSRGNSYHVIADPKHGFYCYNSIDKEACEGWKYSKIRECKHILAFRIANGQKIDYKDKEGNDKQISLPEPTWSE